MRHLVTGAGSGIGAVLAERLHARGDTLVLVARTAARGEELAARYPGSEVLVADLAEPSQVSALPSVGGVLDSVMHVAGDVELARVADQEDAVVRRLVDVNLVAPAILTRLALPAVRRAQGLVLFVNSSAGLASSTDWSAYAAAKAGLRAFADSLRLEEVDHGVRVTTVFPSRTATPMQQKVHEQEGRTYDPANWIRPETVVDTMMHVLDLPLDATIPEVVVRPVVPRR